MLDFLKNDKVKRITVLVCRILLGIVFIFSGYAKAVDPLGGTYKIEDYLTAFGMDFFIPIALIAAVILSSLEFLLGMYASWRKYPFYLFLDIGFHVRNDAVDPLYRSVQSCNRLWLFR